MTSVEAALTRAVATAIALAGLIAADTIVARAGLTLPLLASPALADDDDDDRDGDDDRDDDDDRRPIRREPRRDLILIDPPQAALTRARALGFRIVETVEARAIGLTVVRLTPPRGWTLDRARRALNDIAPNAADVNNVYRPLQGADCTNGCLPHRQINWPNDTRACGINRKLGMIDTAVETTHPALRHARIATRAFTQTPTPPDGHGTAIAALLVGAPNTAFTGLMPRAELLAANPFASHRQGAIADAVAIVRALDWLAENGVRVIGLSFGGPPNLALQRASANLRAKGVILIAAAGNNGRKAQPVYPAAYDTVIAVTAVDARGQAYARANRGAYIDYAAPGVALWTADTNNAGRTRSGTSLAVPFVAAVMAEHMGQSQRTAARDPRQPQQVRTIDLGARGHDEIYGHGLVVHHGGCAR